MVIIIFLIIITIIVIIIITAAAAVIIITIAIITQILSHSRTASLIHKTTPVNFGICVHEVSGSLTNTHDLVKHSPPIAVEAKAGAHVTLSPPYINIVRENRNTVSGNRSTTITDVRDEFKVIDCARTVWFPEEFRRMEEFETL